MRILVIGSGGREHALVWKLSHSPTVKKIFCAPGNPGIAGLAECADIKVHQLEALRDLARKERVDLTVAGPDDCLAAGVADVFREAGLRIFGPTKAAARIESSKAFAKQLMTAEHIPTARYAAFTDHRQACNYLESHPFPLVVKASGLALGKGAVICHDPENGRQALKSMMVDHAFGPAGSEVIIEEFLEGPELSIHALCDGRTAAVCPPVRDHKRAFDGDAGPNTGGMGAFCPVPGVGSEMLDQICHRIIEPVLRSLARDGHPFIGCLYPGLILTRDGLKVLEFNARFGDPETQALLPLLESDLAELLAACADGHLHQADVRWRHRSAVCVIAASEGYPGTYHKGHPISGLDGLEDEPEVTIFQAGTERRDGGLVTAGGRVLGVTATGHDLAEARQRSYRAIKRIGFNGIRYRSDIAANLERAC